MSDKFNKLVIEEDDRITLNGVPLLFVTSVDVHNISPDGIMEAVIRIDIHDADIRRKFIQEDED